MGRLWMSSRCINHGCGSGLLVLMDWWNSRSTNVPMKDRSQDGNVTTLISEVQKDVIQTLIIYLEVIGILWSGNFVWKFLLYMMLILTGPLGHTLFFSKNVVAKNFHQGWILWDDDDNNNKNGALPDGMYNDSPGMFVIKDILQLPAWQACKWTIIDTTSQPAVSHAVLPSQLHWGSALSESRKYESDTGMVPVDT